MALNKDMVFATCDKLFADGTAPTLINIRTLLGEGSYSTISKFLAEWKTASRTAPTDIEFDVPEEISDMFTGPISSLWSAALREANSLYTQEKSDFESRLQDAKSQTEQALSSLDVQAQAMEVFEKELSFRGAKLVEVEEASLLASGVITHLKSQVSTLQAAYDRLLMTIQIQPGIPPSSDYELALTPNPRKRPAKSVSK